MLFASSICCILLLGAVGEGSSTPGPPPPKAASLPARITEVVVRGNERSSAATIRAIADLGIGDEVTDQLIERAKLRLLATGLFSEIDVRAEPTGPGSARAVITVEDKISRVIAPTFSFSSSNIGGGILYGDNNLFGENKKLIAVAQYTSAESGLYFGFENPNVFNWTPLSVTLEALFKLDRTDEYAPGEVSRPDPEIERHTRIESYGGGAGFALTWFETVRTAVRYRYLRVGNFHPEDSPFGPAFGPGPSRADGNVRFSTAYNRLKTYQAIQEGTQLELGVELSSPVWGSDYRYQELGLNFRRGIRFFEQHNLRLRGTAHLGIDTPFHAELVAGGTDLRGFNYRQFRGDTRIAGSVEYHFPLFGIGPLAFRGLAFYDAALTFFRSIPEGGVKVDASGQVIRRFLPDQPSGITKDAFGNGIGLGFRLYLNNVVLPLLGVDYGYGINSNASRFYLVIGIG